MSAPRSRTLKRLARFGATGVFATAVHYAALVALVERAGVAPAPANGLAFLLAVGVTYAGQSLWVFPDAGRLPVRRRLARFAVAALAGIGANVGLMALFTGLASLSYHVGFAICLLVVPAASFALARLWVFAPDAR